MGETTGFLKWERETPTRRPVPVRLRDWNEVYEPFPDEQARSCRPAAAWTAASRSATTAARSATSSPTGTTSSTATTGATRSSGCTPPTTSPSSPGGCARRRARRRACSASARIRSRSSRSRSRSSSGRGPRAGSRRSCPTVRTGRKVAVVGSGPAGLAAAQQLDPRRPLGGGVRARRPHRRPAALRHPRVQDGEAPPRPSPRADGGRGHRVPGERERRRRRRASTQLRERVRRHRARRRRHRVARPADPGPRARRHPPGDGVPAAGATACSRATSTSRPSPPRASTSSSSAAATPAPTAWARRTARARRRCTSSRSCPGRPTSRAPTNPWPTWSNVFRVSSAHEEGGERVYSVNTECFLADDDGNVRALRAHEVEMIDGKFEKIEGTDFELPCELVLLAMGFLGPQREGLLEQLGRRARRARQRGARPVVHDQRARRVRVRRHGPGPEPHRVGDRRGTFVRGRGRHLADGGDAPPRADHALDPAAPLAAAAGPAPGRQRRRTGAGHYRSSAVRGCVS